MTVDPPLDGRAHDAPSPAAGAPSPDSAGESSPHHSASWSFDSRSPDLGWSSVSSAEEPPDPDPASPPASSSTDLRYDPGVIARAHTTAAEAAPDGAFSATTADQVDSADRADGSPSAVEELATMTTAFVPPDEATAAAVGADSARSDRVLADARSDRFLADTPRAASDPADRLATSEAPEPNRGLARLNIGRRTYGQRLDVDDRSGPLLESISAFKAPEHPKATEPSFWRSVLEASEEHAVSIFRRQAFVAGAALLAMILLAAFSLPRAFEGDPGPGLLETAPTESTTPRSPTTEAANDAARVPLLPAAEDRDAGSDSTVDPELAPTSTARSRSNQAAAVSSTVTPSTESSTTAAPPLAPSSVPTASSTATTAVPTSSVVGGPSASSETSAPDPDASTVSPTSAPVSSSAPTTATPTSQPPTTKTPTTKTPTTKAPTTKAPTTATPSTAPTTKTPTTKTPTTKTPTTETPTTKAPTTQSPTTVEAPTEETTVVRGSVVVAGTAEGASTSSESTVGGSVEVTGPR